MENPLLWAILASNIPQSRNTTTLVLADDIAFTATADSIEEAQNYLQTAVNSFADWATQWGLTISPEKSKLMCFTRKRINAIPGITINDVQIPFVARHCFLGRYLDGPRLTWKHHIEYLKQNCTKRLDMMKRIAGKNWGANSDSLTAFYKAYIRSKLDYGSILYSSASKTCLRN